MVARAPLGSFDDFVHEPKPSLAKVIQSQFAPTLRRDGFSGTGQRYWRVIGDQCQVIEVQGSRYGGKFAVNMGIQPMAVPLRSGDNPVPKRMRNVDRVFNKRLAIQEADHWWDYQLNQVSMEAAVRDACVMYEQVGGGQLEFLAQPNSPMNTLTPEAFAARTFDFKGFGNTSILMALTQAQMRKAAGKNAEARGFAQVALEEIGDGARGSGLRAELRALLDSVKSDHID
jgi:hypothetical protein